MNKILKHPAFRRWIQNREFRAKVSLHIGMAVNLFFAVMKFIEGLYYRSVWFSAVGIYYLFLGLMRFFLLRGEWITEKENNPYIRRRKKIRVYRFSGWMLLIMSLIMGGMIVQMVVQNKSFDYPGVLIYASAAYVFYCVVTAVWNYVHFRDLKSPVLSAAKTIGLATAFMSLFSLQTAMLVKFSGDPGYRRMMNSVVGGLVVVLTIFLAVRMAVRGKRILQEERLE